MTDDVDGLFIHFVRATKITRLVERLRQTARHEEFYGTGNPEIIRSAADVIEKLVRDRDKYYTKIMKIRELVGYNEQDEDDEW